MNKYEEAFVIVKHHFNGSDCNYCPNEKCSTCRFALKNNLVLNACKKAQVFDILAKYLKIEEDYYDNNGICEKCEYLACYLEDITQEEFELLKEILSNE